MERRLDDALGRKLSAERRLGPGRGGAAMRLDRPWIAIPRERRQLGADAVPKQSLDGMGRMLRQLPDGGDADSGEPRLRGRAHAPHERHWQFVKEIEFGRWMDDDQSVWLRDLRGDLRQVLRPC